MGNRAVITTESARKNIRGYESDYIIQQSDEIGVYLHWNGGRDSVQAFLKYCDMRGFRSPESDSYGWARLVQVISNFMGPEGLSIGIDSCKYLDCDNYDNGVYIIKDWKIIGRAFFEGMEQDEYNLYEMLVSIDEAQPVAQQIGAEKIKELLEAEGNDNQ